MQISNVQLLIFMSCNNQATGSWDCMVRLWPLTDGKMNVTCLKGHTSNIHAVAFSSNSLLVSTCTVFFHLLIVTKCKSNCGISFMASFVNRQDEPNRVL